MQVWITGHHGFYVKLLGCLLTILTRLKYTSCFGQQIATFRVELKLHKGQGLYVIWAEKYSGNKVSVLKPPLCITSIPKKMNWPFCFYEYLGYFLSTKDSQAPLSIHFNLLKKYSFHVKSVKTQSFDWEMDLWARID